MIIAVISYKGGVGKTTAAIHLAAYLQSKAPTLLIDGDDNRYASSWAGRGALPFKVVTPYQLAGLRESFEHRVIDTQARPNDAEVRDLASYADLFIVPVTPDAMALEGLLLTTAALTGAGASDVCVLLSIVPPHPSHDGQDAREMIRANSLKTFKGEIRRRVAFQKAALSGAVVNQVTDPRAAEAWADYVRVGREILK